MSKDLTEHRKTCLMKEHRKSDLVDMVVSLNDEADRLARINTTDTREIKKVMEDRDQLKKRLAVEVDRLSDIQKAIETICAVRFPGAEFNRLPSHSVYQPTLEPVEPDELLALRHLYSLTGF